MAFARPKPPNRRTNTTTTTNQEILQPTSPILTHPKLTGATPIPTTPSASPFSAQLKTKLSASNLSMSVVPDSPPTTHDALLFLPSGNTILTPRSSKSNLSKASSTNSFHSSISTGIPFPSKASPRDPTAVGPSGSFQGVHAQSSSGAEFGAGEDSIGSIGASDEGEESAHWLQQKSRTELEELLLKADREMKDRERDLEAAARYGKQLIEENNRLRSRHESLLNSSPTKSFSNHSHPQHELRDRPLPSPGRRPWRNSLGRTSLVLGRTTTDLDEWDNDEDFSSRTRTTSFGGRLSNASSYPITPIRSSRNRISSTASVASLFAPTPRLATTPHENLPATVQQLNEEVMALNEQNQELQAEVEKAEKLGRKNKKLSRENDELRRQLEYAESRGCGEEEDIPQNALSFGGDYREYDSGLSRDSSSSSIVSQARGLSPTTLDISRFADEDHNNQNTPLASTSGGNPFNNWNAHQSPSTPTLVRRTPGVGFSDSVERRRRELGNGGEDEKEVIEMLKRKIEDLQEENKIIEGEKEDMNERLERAQRDLDIVKERCEELTNVIESAFEPPVQGTIEWPTNDEDFEGEDGSYDQEYDYNEDEEDSHSPQLHLRGNQKVISQRRQSQLFGSPSTSSQDGTSTTSSPSKSNGTARNLTRSLGSELGDWDSEGDIDEEEEEEEFDDRELSYGTARGCDQTFAEGSSLRSPFLSQQDSSSSSTLKTPPRSSSSSHRRDITPLFYESKSDPTSPDLTEYEQLSQSVASIPVVWEDDKPFKLTGGISVGPSPPRQPSIGVVKSLRWASESDRDTINENLRKYPEADEEERGENGMLRIEGGEKSTAFDEKKLRWGKVRRRRYDGGSSLFTKDKGKRRASVDDEAEGGEEGEDDKLSRREMALKRIGLTERRRKGLGGSSDDDDDEDDEEETSSSTGSAVSSNYDLLRSTEYGKRSADYYPVALRARYAPRMVLIRTADSALSHAVMVLTYIKFIVVLGFALFYALWQGPKQTLGIVERRKRLSGPGR